MTTQQVNALNDIRDNLNTHFSKLKDELAPHLTSTPNIHAIRKALDEGSHNNKGARKIVKEFRTAFSSVPLTPSVKITSPAGKTTSSKQPNKKNLNVTLKTIIQHLMQVEKSSAH